MEQFIGIYQNGTTITRSFLADFNHLDDIKFILKKAFYNEWKADRNVYQNHKYTLVSLNGEPRDFRIGYFKLYDIGPEDNDFNRCTISYEIKNVNTNEIHSFSIYNAYTHEFFLKNIVLMMNNLNHYGSYEAYQNSFKIESLERENKALKDEVKRLKEEISKLK